MPAVAKTINVIGALAKLESTYGSAVTLTTTDGFLLSFTDRSFGAPITLNYAFDGVVGVNPGSLGNAPLTQPGGKSFQGTLPVRFRGAGSAYSASVKPALADIVLAIAGFDGTLTSTTGSEAWTYTPTLPTAAYKSATMALYARGELWPIKGVVANWSFDFSNPAPPVHNVQIQGIANGDVTDAALPSITYPNLTVEPPNANGITVTIGNFSTNAVVYSGSFALNRTLEPRVALTSGTGHEGFIPRGRAPELKVVVEDTAFVGSPYHSSAGLDPIKLREAATKVTVSVQFGSVQYNRWRLTLSNCQLSNVAPTAVGGAACWELTFRPSTSTPIANDDITVTFD